MTRPLFAALILTGLGLYDRRSLAIEDIPPGGLVWLQGYDLNPPTPGFRNEGTLRFESVDDSLPVGLRVVSGALTNATNGVILFNPGAGGSRTLIGNLINQGQVIIRAGTTFEGRGSVTENWGRIELASYALWILPDRDQIFLQAAGALVVGEGFELRDGTFRYAGGMVDGEPQLLRSRLVLDPGVSSNAFKATLLGTGAGLVGVIGPEQVVRVHGTSKHGDAVALVSDGLRVEGQLLLSSETPSATPRLNILGPPLIVGPEGLLSASLDRGGARRLDGPVRLMGRVEVPGKLYLADNRPATNTGTIHIGPNAEFGILGGFAQENGMTEIEDSVLDSFEGISLTGGELRGFGQIIGGVTNAARVSVEPHLGKLRVDGDWYQGSAGTVRVVLGDDPPAGTGAPLDVSGTARLAGALQIAWTGARPPEPGRSALLMHARSLRGEFERLDLPGLPEGLSWDLMYDRQELRAVVTSTNRPPRFELTCEPDGCLLEIVGSPTAQLRIDVSTNLLTWDVVRVFAPFVGRATITNAVANESASAAFFRGVAN